MIDEALEYLRRELRNALDLDDTEVVLGRASNATDIAGTSGVSFSLVNIEEDATRRHSLPVQLPESAASPATPPIHLNLSLLIRFDFGNYKTSLQRLSQTIEFFQANPIFTSTLATERNPLPMKKVSVELQNLTLEQWSHLRGRDGGGDAPSVLYKVRLIPE
jgi:hypothetical protein